MGCDETAFRVRLCTRPVPRAAVEVPSNLHWTRCSGFFSRVVCQAGLCPLFRHRLCFCFIRSVINPWQRGDKRQETRDERLCVDSGRSALSRLSTEHSRRFYPLTLG